MNSEHGKTTLIRGGKLVSPEAGVFEGSLLIRGSRITAVMEPSDPYPKADRVIDAQGLWVFPGFIDPHVHIGNYREYNRDVANQTRAAASGGVTTIFTFIKTAQRHTPETSFLDILDEYVCDFTNASYVDVGMHAVISSMHHVQEVDRYLKRGLKSLKFYMGYRGDPQAMRRGSVALGDGEIYQGFRAIARARKQGIAMTHAENEEINRAILGELLKSSPSPSLKEWFRTRPDFAEAEATSRAAHLAKGAACPLYVVHVTSAAALAEIERHRENSSEPIYAEVTTHHLLLSEDRGEQLDSGAAAKTTPPLRPQADLDALWEGVRRRAVDTVASDTCPVDPTDKMDVLSAEPGFSALDVFPAIFVTEAMKRDISLQQIAELSSQNAAKIFGLYPSKGTLRPGADADLALLSLDEDWTYKQSESISDSSPSPYEGWRLKARNMMTLLRGNVIFQDNKLVGTPRGTVLLDQTD